MKRGETPPPPRQRARAAAETVGSSTELPSALAPKVLPPHRCTDVCCLLLFVAFNGGLAFLFKYGRENGDMRRLTHGFDFNFNLCGGDSTQLDSNTSVSKGDFLYWCSNGTTTNWESPICVKECPQGAETVHFCPTGKKVSKDTEKKKKDGSITIITQRKTTLKPTKATKTRKVFQYCLPTHLGESAWKDLVGGQSSHGRWSDLPREMVGHVVQLMETPTLLKALTLAAIVSGLVWIILLQSFAHMLGHVGFIVISFTLTAVGALVVVAPSAASVASLASVVGVPSSSPAIPSYVSEAFSVVMSQVGPLADFNHMVHWLDAMSGGYATSLRLAVGFAFILLGIGVFLWYLYVRKSISLAADSIVAAVRIVCKEPTLIFILPLMNIALLGLAAVGAGLGFVTTMSTSGVQSAPLNFQGSSVVGVYRHLDWSPDFVGSLFCWFFALLWWCELVMAFNSFVLSHTAVRWFFATKGSSRTLSLPIMAAWWQAFRYHLGSLALGAFIMAFIRLLRIFLAFVHYITKDTKDQKKERKWLQWLLGCFDLLLKFAQEVMQRVNDSCYTDLAITSEPYFTASGNAVSIMMENASLVWMRAAVVGPAKFFGSLVYVSSFGWAVYALLGLPYEVLAKPFERFDFLPVELQTQLLQDLQDSCNGQVSQAATAVFAGLMSFIAVSVFTSVVDGVSDAILFCCLWGKRKGCGFDDVPESFKSFLSASTKKTD